MGVGQLHDGHVAAGAGTVGEQPLALVVGEESPEGLQSCVVGRAVEPDGPRATTISSPRTVMVTVRSRGMRQWISVQTARAMARTHASSRFGRCGRGFGRVAGFIWTSYR